MVATGGGGFPGLPMNGVGGIVLAVLIIVGIVFVAKYFLEN